MQYLLIQDIQSIFIFIIKVNWIEDVEKNERTNRESQERSLLFQLYINKKYPICLEFIIRLNDAPIYRSKIYDRVKKFHSKRRSKSYKEKLLKKSSGFW